MKQERTSQLDDDVGDGLEPLAALAAQTRSESLVDLGRPHLNRKMAECVALRVLGLTVKEIAAELRLKPRTVESYLTGARKLAKLNDSVELLQLRAGPMAADNLVELLGDKDAEGRLSARGAEATFRTLDGLGHFKAHTKQDGAAGAAVASQFAFTVIVEQPADRQGNGPNTLTGEIVGTPRTLPSAPSETGSTP